MLFKFVLVGASLFASQLVIAASVPVNPGLWEMSMTRNNPQTGQPESITRRECIKMTEFNPKSMLGGTKGCGVTQEEVKGNTMTFTMTCKGPQGDTATYRGRYQTDGKTASGSMDSSINYKGRVIKMSMSWVGKHLSADCPPPPARK